MQKLQNTIFWTVIVSESSHVFCCVLPALFSVLSLLAGVGVIGVLPGWLVHVHDALHVWEVPLIVFSAFILALGWALFFYSRKIDCHDTGCAHGPCKPKKKATGTILKIATVLFVFNLAVYTLIHRSGVVDTPPNEHVHTEQHS